MMKRMCLKIGLIITICIANVFATIYPKSKGTEVILITKIFVRVHEDACGLRPLVKGRDADTGRVVGGTVAMIGDW